jgi:hypothetical protein
MHYTDVQQVNNIMLWQSAPSGDAALGLARITNFFTRQSKE